MDQEARARLNNIAVVNADKARAIEAQIIQLARSGQIRGKMTDADLKEVLDQVCSVLYMRMYE